MRGCSPRSGVVQCSGITNCSAPMAAGRQQEHPGALTITKRLRPIPLGLMPCRQARLVPKAWTFANCALVACKLFRASEGSKSGVHHMNKHVLNSFTTACLPTKLPQQQAAQPKQGAFAQLFWRQPKQYMHSESQVVVWSCSKSYFNCGVHSF